MTQSKSDTIFSNDNSIKEYDKDLWESFHNESIRQEDHIDPAGGPGRGLASRRAWQGPWHRPAAKVRRGALFEACDEATDAPTDEQASGVAPDAERSEAIQNQGRRATGAREIAN